MISLVKRGGMNICALLTYCLGCCVLRSSYWCSSVDETNFGFFTVIALKLIRLPHCTPFKRNWIVGFFIFFFGRECKKKLLSLWYFWACHLLTASKRSLQDYFQDMKLKFRGLYCHLENVGVCW